MLKEVCFHCLENLLYGRTFFSFWTMQVISILCFLAERNVFKVKRKKKSKSYKRVV